MRSHPIMTVLVLSLMLVLLAGGQTAIAEKNAKSTDSKTAVACCPEAKQCPPEACTPEACATMTAKCGGIKAMATCGGTKAKANCSPSASCAPKCCPEALKEACCPSGSAKAAPSKTTDKSAKKKSQLL